MELNKQVTSLELSKKLKELGVPQDSLFYWQLSPKPRLLPKESEHTEVDCATMFDNCVSAFSVAELGEMLPTYNEKTAQYIEIKKDDDNNNPWSVGFRCPIPQIEDMYFHCPTLVEAMAEMLIWLIQNNYLSLPTEE